MSIPIEKLYKSMLKGVHVNSTRFMENSLFFVFF